MNFSNKLRKTILAFSVTGAAAFGALGVGSHTLLPSASAAQAAASSDSQMAQQKLNTFYKPALKGHFPDRAEDFVIGQTTRSEVMDAFGSPDVARTSASGFDSYTANMGNPGYSLSYTSGNVLKEIRYFGTNVERQTNIGGITVQMVKKNWYAPTSTTTIKNGKTTQTKLTYKRGDYHIEFIFDSPTKLSHINLVKG
ncbi:YjgB family protein [Saccharibacillus sp. CPCC 101409]|uniref:YjgB family protein n=1 Tax=Saccharibacillus sp. CPCC 101409 TaxID=3058041 RepID=UPI0026710A79|nr:YjgB family protein [Saccharibacillus sp. CPCC 101409]MDO3411728.1 YjgB family protein [Saccharibacillus sp. CPCC 101409]